MLGKVHVAEDEIMMVVENYRKRQKALKKERAESKTEKNETAN